MTKHKITTPIVALVATATAIIGCTKPENPELPINDTVGTDTVVPEKPEEPQDNIYQFKILDGAGDSVPLAQYRDKELLVVNTATQCGYTPQYTDLQRIYQPYQDSRFLILHLPCNQFNGQPPGDYDDIHDLCTRRYRITLPQSAKNLVNPPNASPLHI